MPRTISISCDDCELQDTSACDDCLVTFVLGREPDDAVVVDVDEARAMRMLSVPVSCPELRHPGAPGLGRLLTSLGPEVRSAPGAWGRRAGACQHGPVRMPGSGRGR